MFIFKLNFKIMFLITYILKKYIPNSIVYLKYIEKNNMLQVKIENNLRTNKGYTNQRNLKITIVNK